MGDFRRTIKFKAYYWNYEDTDDGMIIHLGGKTRDGESVHCQILGFTPFVYLELPLLSGARKWDRTKYKILYEYLRSILKSQGPTSYQYMLKYKLKYRTPCEVLFLTFPSHKATRSLANFFTKNRMIDNIGFFKANEFKVHEHNIDPILKFTTAKQLDLAGWMEVVETIQQDDLELSVEDRKYSSAAIDLYANWEDVNQYVPEENIIIFPKYMSFDIECYSHNHNSKIPDPKDRRNFIFSIACTFGLLGDKSTPRSILLTIGDPLPIPDVLTVNFNKGTLEQQEKALLLYFKKVIVEEDPDTFITYNGLKFDWNYIIERAKLLGIFPAFSQITRLYGRKAQEKTVNWSSSAYGHQQFSYLDPFGRTNIDVLLDVERNHRLATYSLGAVSEHFLKEKKGDISARQLFMLVKLTLELTPIVNVLSKGVIPQIKRREIKTHVINILERRRCSGEVKTLRDDLMAAKVGENFVTLIRKALHLTGKYNVQDTLLPVKLAEVFNLGITMEELSNCMCIPMSYLHTRGTQIRTVAQIFRRTLFENIIIPFVPREKDAKPEKYQGAVVIDAKPGYYEKVFSLDFEGLYPSVIIAYNICYTTLVEDSNPIPDTECHVLEWGDHVACLVKGTQISLSNRSLPIENLSSHKGEVFGWDETKKGVIKTKQTNYFNQGIKECVRLTLEDGSILECTPDHRILTSESNWVEAKDLEVNSTRVKTCKPGSYGVDAESDVLPTFDLLVIGRKDIGLRETFDLEIETTHSFIANGVVVHNCVHDVQKRKKKAEDILCKEHRYRFRRVRILPDGTKEGEGLMPALERHLLSNRKVKKKEMAKLDAKLKMVLGVATEEDIAYYKKMGWDIVKKGSLTSKQIEILKISISVLNAQQLALKVSANGAYGGMGMQAGMIPLVPGAASVTSMGRSLITKAIEYITGKYSSGVDRTLLVYGDTDSCMITCPEKNTDDAFMMGDRTSREVTHYLKTKLMDIPEDYEVWASNKIKYRIDKYPRDKIQELPEKNKILIYQYDANPINVQFENLYSQYLLLTKKRYMAIAVNRKGQVINNIKKGVVLVRRDNCQYLKDVYGDVAGCIMKTQSESEIMDRLLNQIHRAFTRQVPDANLITYMGVKSVMSYAKRKEVKQGKSVVDTVYLDSDGHALPTKELVGPLDPRLVYPNLVQVFLSLKILRRGDEIPPNTRLEYLYIENDNAIYQGEKAEDYVFYKENKHLHHYKPDYLHYIEKQLSKPITELIEVKFPRAKVPYEKLEDVLDRCISGLDPLLKHRVEQTKKYSRVMEPIGGPHFVGWGCRCRGCHIGRCNIRVEGIPHTPTTEYKSYEYKGKAAQVQYILDSALKKKLNPKIPNEIDEKKYPELLRVCRRWKAWNIINRCHSQHKIKKRSLKKPTQTGEKLRLGTKEGPTGIILVKEVMAIDGKVWPIGSECSLAGMKEDKSSKNTKSKSYVYDLKMGDGLTIIKGVSRASFTTFHYRDGTFMKDIVTARRTYKSIIKHLNYLFLPVDFGPEDTHVDSKDTQVEVDPETNESE